jgi:peptidoglycan/LPS O-acetylase OafA/YrhL
MNKNDNLEIIRGLAALVVVLCHIIGKIPIPIFQNSVLFSLLGNWGTEAVIIFFVLSGIVIGISQEAKPRDRNAFIRNRLLRILPIFIIGFLLALIVNILYHNSLPDMGVMIGSLFFVSTLQGWITGPLEFNPVIWSLTFEMFFYLIFSATINNKKVLILWCLLSVLCIPFYYSTGISSGIIKHFIAMFAFSSIWLVGYFIQRYRHLFSFNFVNALFSLFALPMVSRLSITTEHYDVIKYLIFALVSIPLFGYILKPVRFKFNNALSVQIVITLVLITFLQFYSESSFYNKLIYSTIPFFAFIVLAFKNFFVRVYAAVSIYLVFLGGISYSLYILHYPIIFLTMFFLKDYLFLLLLISLPFIFLICIFLEKFYQKRITSFIRR